MWKNCESLKSNLVSFEKVKIILIRGFSFVIFIKIFWKKKIVVEVTI